MNLVGQRARHKVRRLAGQLPDKPLVLVGMMGAGKSSIGRLLASALQREFMDADTEIEKAANCTIEDIFTLYGEEAFRDAERRIIARLMKSKQTVLATGGGAVTNSETREIIRRDGVSIWLNVEPDILLERILRRDDRPLLKVDDKRATLERLVEERRCYYAEADIVIRVGEEEIEFTFEKVITALESQVGGAELSGRGDGRRSTSR